MVRLSCIWRGQKIAAILLLVTMIIVIAILYILPVIAVTRAIVVLDAVDWRRQC